MLVSYLPWSISFSLFQRGMKVNLQRLENLIYIRSNPSYFFVKLTLLWHEVTAATFESSYLFVCSKRLRHLRFEVWVDSWKALYSAVVKSNTDVQKKIMLILSKEACIACLYFIGGAVQPQLHYLLLVSSVLCVSARFTYSELLLKLRTEQLTKSTLHYPYPYPGPSQVLSLIMPD